MKQVFHVPDMHCPACVMLLEGIEDTLPGIRRIAGSYRKQQLVVEYDEAVVDEARIVAAAETLGYILHHQTQG
jgi:copper chaperone